MNRSLRSVLLGLFLAVFAAGVGADIILTARNLNASLKQMQRLHSQLRDAAPSQRPAVLFHLVVTADDLALLLTNEVLAHGMLQKGLIDLGIRRAAAVDVSISWYPDKERYLYDGRAFRQYLDQAPKDPHAAECSFRLLQIAFFRPGGDDPLSLRAAAQRKRDFLQSYSGNKHAPQVGIMLAIDYRDLWRRYRDAGDTANAGRYLQKTRQQLQRVAADYPGADEATIAGRLRQRVDAEAAGGAAAGAPGGKLQ